jgi:hypothetical protein
MVDVNEKKLIAALSIVFLFGISLSIYNGYHMKVMGHPFCGDIYIVSIVSLAIGGLITLMFQWKINKTQLQRIIKILPHDEARIVNILVEKGETTQTELKNVTGLSKVKISRILTKLEERGTVKKKPYGNTNLISLTI